MAKTATKELLIEYELKFLEKSLKELKKYITARPVHKLEDRSVMSSTRIDKDGNETLAYKIVATIEVQRRDVSQAIMDYAAIVRTVDQMRTQEDKKKKVAVRGDEKLGSQAAKFLEGRDNKGRT